MVRPVYNVGNARLDSVNLYSAPLKPHSPLRLKGCKLSLLFLIDGKYQCHIDIVVKKIDIDICKYRLYCEVIATQFLQCRQKLKNYISL